MTRSRSAQSRPSRRGGERPASHIRPRSGKPSPSRDRAHSNGARASAQRRGRGKGKGSAAGGMGGRGGRGDPVGTSRGATGSSVPGGQPLRDLRMFRFDIVEEPRVEIFRSTLSKPETDGMRGSLDFDKPTAVEVRAAEEYAHNRGAPDLPDGFAYKYFSGGKSKTPYIWCDGCQKYQGTLCMNERAWITALCPHQTLEEKNEWIWLKWGMNL